MPDAIARMSEALARDPAGLGWIALGEAHRRARRLDAAERTALRGLGRHPYHADGHDLLARIAADRGDVSRARDEWEMAARLEPGHLGALLGLSWLAFRAGDRLAAHRWWEAARERAPGDPRVVAAARRFDATVPDARSASADSPAAQDPPVAQESAMAQSPPATDHASVGAPAPTRLGSLAPDGARFVLLADGDGLVLAGSVGEGAEGPPADEVAAELSGLAHEARGALEQLQLGGWERLHVECEALSLAMAPEDGVGVVLVATEAATPSGVSRLLLDRTRARARAWLSAL